MKLIIVILGLLLTAVQMGAIHWGTAALYVGVPVGIFLLRVWRSPAFRERCLVFLASRGL